MRGRVGEPPTLRRDLTMTQQHKAVQAAYLLLDGLDKRKDGFRGDPCRLRASAGKPAAALCPCAGFRAADREVAQHTGGSAESDAFAKGTTAVIERHDENSLLIFTAFALLLASGLP